MRRPLSQIRVSLVTSLGAGQIIFLTGIGAVENKVRYYIKNVESLCVNPYDGNLLLTYSVHATFSILCSLPVLQ